MEDLQVCLAGSLSAHSAACKFQSLKLLRCIACVRGQTQIECYFIAACREREYLLEERVILRRQLDSACMLTSRRKPVLQLVNELQFASA